jgi:hypothetical protein
MDVLGSSSGPNLAAALLLLCARSVWWPINSRNAARRGQFLDGALSLSLSLFAFGWDEVRDGRERGLRMCPTQCHFACGLLGSVFTRSDSAAVFELEPALEGNMEACGLLRDGNWKSEDFGRKVS